MEPEGSLPHSQEPTTCPYPEPDQSSPCPHPTSRRSILILRSHLRLGLPSGLFFHSGHLARTVYAPLFSPIRVTCPAHLILLDSIIRTVFAEVYKSFSSSVCSLLHFLVTSSLLSPYIPLVTLFSTLRLRSSLNESDQVSHPDNTTGKIIRVGGGSSTCNLRTRHVAVTLRTYRWSVNDGLVNSICDVYLCALFKKVCLDIPKQFNPYPTNVENRVSS